MLHSLYAFVVYFPKEKGQPIQVFTRVLIDNTSGGSDRDIQCGKLEDSKFLLVRGYETTTAAYGWVLTVNANYTVSVGTKTSLNYSSGYPTLSLAIKSSTEALVVMGNTYRCYVQKLTIDGNTISHSLGTSVNTSCGRVRIKYLSGDSYLYCQLPANRSERVNRFACILTVNESSITVGAHSTFFDGETYSYGSLHIQKVDSSHFFLSFGEYLSAFDEYPQGLVITIENNVVTNVGTPVHIYPFLCHFGSSSCTVIGNHFYVFCEFRQPTGSQGDLLCIEGYIGVDYSVSVLNSYMTNVDAIYASMYSLVWGTTILVIMDATITDGSGYCPASIYCDYSSIDLVESYSGSIDGIANECGLEGNTIGVIVPNVANLQEETIMHIITDKTTDVITLLSPDIDYQENGNPLVNGGTLAIGFPCNVSEDVEIPDGVCEQKYTYKDGVFAKNPDYPWPKLEDVQAQRIAESKTALAEYLASHPLTWTDGKQYSATEDKQALLTGNIAAYQLAVTLGQEDPELTWNATGEECTVWTFENLAALAIAIKAYVKPLVAYQQKTEISIRACTTVEDVESVPLDYGSVSNA